jgi:PAS domain-containing protein
MTLKRRLDKLESALPARTAALRWMCEAHRFGSIVAYVDWLGGQPRSAFPLNRVPAQAIAAAAAATKGLPPGYAADAREQALRDALFLVNLILGINAAAADMVGTSAAELVLLAEETLALESEHVAPDPDGEAGGHDRAERRTDWLARARAWLIRLYVAEGAWTLLERRYLDGRPSVFPDRAADLALLREGAEGLFELAAMPTCMRGPITGTRRHGLGLDALHTSAREGAEAEAARLVDMARADVVRALKSRGLLVMNPKIAALLRVGRSRSRRPPPI